MKLQRVSGELEEYGVFLPFLPFDEPVRAWPGALEKIPEELLEKTREVIAPIPSLAELCELCGVREIPEDFDPTQFYSSGPRSRTASSLERRQALEDG